MNTHLMINKSRFTGSTVLTMFSQIRQLDKAVRSGNIWFKIQYNITRDRRTVELLRCVEYVPILQLCLTHQSISFI